MTIFDFIEPAYFSNDEILRLSSERQLEDCIILQLCCGTSPVIYFRSCHEFFVECPRCKKRSLVCKKIYQAMQSWNRGLFQ